MPASAGMTNLLKFALHYSLFTINCYLIFALSPRITLRFIQATHSPLVTLPLPLILCATDAWPFPIRLLQLLA